MSSGDEQAWHCIQLSLDQSHAQSISRLIDDQNILPDLSGYYEVLYDESSPKTDQTTLVLYFPPAYDLATAQIEILMKALDVVVYTIKEDHIKRQDYMEAYKKHYTSFQITKRFRIIPSWEMNTIKVEPENIALNLDPGLAFGTGKHPTSTLCLGWLDEHPPLDRTVIDAGCGSGILSIGALLLGAKHVFAFDVDANAVTASNQNLKLNVDQIKGSYTIQKSGFDKGDFANTKADLMIGNLTASILVQNVERIANGQFPEILLSGIILEQEDYLLQEFQQYWHLLERQELDGWLLLHMKKK